MFTAIIPLRKGSKGLPGKNVRLFGGKPLFLHSVDYAINLGADKVVISSDIPEVLTRDYSDNVIALPRPSSLCSGTIEMAPVIHHVIESCGLKGTIVLLQATSPLRRRVHLRQALEVYRTGNYDLVMSVTKADSVVLKWGTLNGDVFVPLRNPEYSFANRQNLPEVVKPNGALYIMGAEWFLENNSFVSDKIGVIRMSADDSLDIDTLSDFAACEEMLLRRQQGASYENC